MQADALGLLCSIHQLQNIFLCVLIASDFPNGKSWYFEFLLEPIEFKTFLVIAEMTFTEIHGLLRPLRSSSDANQSYMFPFVANYETVLRFDSKHFEQSSFSCSEIMLAEKLQFFRSYNWDVNLRPGIYSSKTSPYFYFRTMLSKILKVFLQIRCRNFPCWRWGETWTIEWWMELVNGFVRARVSADMPEVMEFIYVQVGEYDPVRLTRLERTFPTAKLGTYVHRFRKTASLEIVHIFAFEISRIFLVTIITKRICEYI